MIPIQPILEKFTHRNISPLNLLYLQKDIENQKHAVFYTKDKQEILQFLTENQYKVLKAYKEGRLELSNKELKITNDVSAKKAQLEDISKNLSGNYDTISNITDENGKEIDLFEGTLDKLSKPHKITDENKDKIKSTKDDLDKLSKPNNITDENRRKIDSLKKTLDKLSKPCENLGNVAKQNSILTTIKLICDVTSDKEHKLLNVECTESNPSNESYAEMPKITDTKTSKFVGDLYYRISEEGKEDGAFNNKINANVFQTIKYYQEKTKNPQYNPFKIEDEELKYTSDLKALSQEKGLSLEALLGTTYILPTEQKYYKDEIREEVKSKTGMKNSVFHFNQGKNSAVDIMQWKKSEDDKLYLRVLSNSKEQSCKFVGGMVEAKDGKYNLQSILNTSRCETIEETGIVVCGELEKRFSNSPKTGKDGKDIALHLDDAFKLFDENGQPSMTYNSDRKDEKPIVLPTVAKQLKSIGIETLGQLKDLAIISSVGVANVGPEKPIFDHRSSNDSYNSSSLIVLPQQTEEVMKKWDAIVDLGNQTKENIKFIAEGKNATNEAIASELTTYGITKVDEVKNKFEWVELSNFLKGCEKSLEFNHALLFLQSLNVVKKITDMETEIDKITKKHYEDFLKTSTTINFDNFMDVDDNIDIENTKGVAENSKINLPTQNKSEVPNKQQDRPKTPEVGSIQRF